jgi:hypothetical protein
MDADLLFDPRAGVACFGIPMILYEPVASFLGAPASFCKLAERSSRPEWGKLSKTDIAQIPF